LTGENKPRRKILEAIATTSFGELALNERENIAFMGTLVRNGEWILKFFVQAFDINHI
jgi:Ca2+-transporting ATPase